jgi:hypothetical protein
MSEVKSHKKRQKKNKNVVQRGAGALNYLLNEQIPKAPSSSSSEEIPETSCLSHLSPLSGGSSFNILDAAGHPIKNYGIQFLVDYVDVQIASIKKRFKDDHEIICPPLLIQKFEEAKGTYESLYVQNLPLGKKQKDIDQRLKALLSTMKSNEQEYLLDKANEQIKKDKENEQIKKDKENEQKKTQMEKEKEMEMEEKQKAKEGEKQIKIAAIVATTIIAVVIAVAWTLSSIYSPIRH